MRVNIYEEEITDEVKFVWTSPNPGRKFLGVRFFLKSSQSLHNTPDDDDRSAITFWLKDEKNAERFFTNVVHRIKQS